MAAAGKIPGATASHETYSVTNSASELPSWSLEVHNYDMQSPLLRKHPELNWPDSPSSISLSPQNSGKNLTSAAANQTRTNLSNSSSRKHTQVGGGPATGSPRPQYSTVSPPGSSFSSGAGLPAGVERTPPLSRSGSATPPQGQQQSMGLTEGYKAAALARQQQQQQEQEQQLQAAAALAIGGPPAGYGSNSPALASASEPSLADRYTFAADQRLVEGLAALSGSTSPSSSLAMSSQPQAAAVDMGQLMASYSSAATANLNSKLTGMNVGVA